MAKKTVNERYIPGDYYMECDRCGLSYRRSDLKRDGYKKGLMVCRSCWDFKPTYPSPPPDRISVPIPRPDNTSVSANSTTYTYTYIGDNLFPDPWISLANDGLWNRDGVLSQDHVRYNTYSRKLPAAEEYINVSGLEVGKTYRFSMSGWHEEGRTKVLINGIESDIFSGTPIGGSEWIDAVTYFTAPTTTIQIEFLTGGRTVRPSITTYIDGIYIQEYIVEERSISYEDIFNNKVPPSDILIDKTITPSPNLIDWGSINLFPDPDISLANVPLWDVFFFNVPPTTTVTTSRSSEQYLTSGYSRKVEYSSDTTQGSGVYIDYSDFIIDKEYKLTVNGYFLNSQVAPTIFIGSFTVGGDEFIIFPQTTQPLDQWIQDSVEFTFLSSYLTTNIYIGQKGLGTSTVYYDSISLNIKINETTPF